MAARLSLSKESPANSLGVMTPNPVPAALTVAGGAGYSTMAPYMVNVAPGQPILTVGAGQMYSTIAAAIAAAPAGALILVQPGTYVNDFADITRPVTIAGAGGMVNLVATEDLPNEKGFLIVDNSCEIDNLTFQGGHIADALGGNGAGIRYQGGNLVLNNDAFVANQDGVLAGAVDNLPQNTITISACTFDQNGNATGPNAGYTHNLYVSAGISALNISHSVLEEANVGHELKSRALTNLISNNIFYDGPSGTASYSIDLPNGGMDTVTGNLIEKGPLAQNDAAIHFGGEGLPYAGSALLVQGNHFVNDLGPAIDGVLNQTTLNVAISNNEFDNFPTGAIASGPYTLNGNYDQTGAAIANGSSSLFAPGTDILDFTGDALPHNVTLTSSIGVLGGAGMLGVVAQAGHVTVVGGSGGLNYQEGPGWGGSAIVTFMGAGDTVSAAGQDLIQSNGNDLIALGAGNGTVQVNGSASISAGTGDSGFTIAGAASITGAGGADTVQVAATCSASINGSFTYLQSTIQGGSETVNISTAGMLNQASIAGGEAALLAYNGALVVSTAGGGGTNLTFGSGTVGDLWCYGTDTVQAGSGPTTVIALAAAQIHAGSGSLTIYGRGASGASVYGAAGSVLLSGDTGDISYFGGAAANSLTLQLSNVTVLGGSGRLSVTGGSNETITGGSGGLVFSTQDGADFITTAAGAQDSIGFLGACVVSSNGNDVINAGQGNASITANGNATITGSSGNAFYVLNGHDSLAAHGYTRATVGGAAQDSITAYGSLTSVALTGGTLAFTEQANTNRQTATVAGANASLVCSTASNATSITLGGQGDRATLAAGRIGVWVNSTGTRINQAGGSDTIMVGAGGGLIKGGAGSLLIAMNDWVDHSVTSISGGSGALVQQAGYGNLVFLGGSGTASLGGISGGETIVAGSGNITLVGGNAGTVFTAGAGAAALTLTAAGGTITAGSGTVQVAEASWGGAVTYDFIAGHGGGSESISGFRSGTDILHLQGVTVASETLSGGGAQVTLSDGTHISFTGLNAVPVFVT